MRSIFFLLLNLLSLLTDIWLLVLVNIVYFPRFSVLPCLLGCFFIHCTAKVGTLGELLFGIYFK